jgi:hypothetical protein
MATYFHGTSFRNLRSILKNGLQVNCDKLWLASRNEVYLWSPDMLVKYGDAEEDWKDETAKERAYDSAQIAIAVDPKCGKCAVLEIELDSNEVTEDDSCENMSGAVCTTSPIRPNQIKRIWVSPDLSMIKGCFLAGILQNNLFDSSLVGETEKQIAKVFANSEFYFNSSDFPLKEMKRRKV